MNIQPLLRLVYRLLSKCMRMPKIHFIVTGAADSKSPSKQSHYVQTHCKQVSKLVGEVRF